MARDRGTCLAPLGASIWGGGAAEGGLGRSLPRRSRWQIKKGLEED